jgi:hypothetical protein
MMMDTLLVALLGNIKVTVMHGDRTIAVGFARELREGTDWNRYRVALITTDTDYHGGLVVSVC